MQSQMGMPGEGERREKEELLATLGQGDCGADGCWNKDMFSASSFLVCSLGLLSGRYSGVLTVFGCQELNSR